MRRAAFLRAAVLALTAVLATGGCTRSASEPASSEEPASPLAGCEPLTAPPSGSAGPDAPAGATADPTGAGPLPEVTLPCFTGAEPVGLAALRGPAVVNVWASWCPPCREELPAFQRYAERAAGEVHVVGVVSEDTRARAAALAADLGVTFPALYDPEAELRDALGLAGLPATLLVDAAGRVRHLHQGPALAEQELAALVTAHLGVDPPGDDPPGVEEPGGG